MARCNPIAFLAILIASLTGRLLSAITIDDFSAGTFSIEVLRYETESVTLTSLPPNSTLGGTRFVSLNGLGPTPQSSVRVGVDTASTEFHYDADPGATAANFAVAYGWSTNLQANLLSDGSNALVFDFRFADFEPGFGNFDISVTTQPGRQYLYVPVQNSASPFSLVLPYRAFQKGSAGANFANVSRIVLGTGNGNLRGDFALTGIRTAFFPEGDFNFDGNVDGQDYSLWRSHVGSVNVSYPIDAADGNRDGRVDAADYVLWRRGATVGGGSLSSGVPEPTTLTMQLSIWLSITSVRRKRRFK